MINIVLKQIGDFVKKTFLFRKSEWLYGKLVNTLFSWKWIARLLAHGGIHFILLILLLCQAIYMWIALKENNVTSFNQICYCFYGDTLHNYQLNYLFFQEKKLDSDIYLLPITDEELKDALLTTFTINYVDKVYDTI